MPASLCQKVFNNQHSPQAFLVCQHSNVHPHTRAPLDTFAGPPQRFDQVRVDLMGPIQLSQGYTYLFTIVDRCHQMTAGYPTGLHQHRGLCQSFHLPLDHLFWYPRRHIL